MTTAPLVLSIDQGTSGTKCLLIDRLGQVVARGQAPLGEQHPAPGWVEQDPEEVWASVVTAVARCLDRQDASRVAAVGLSTQRESCLLWERASGLPVSPLLSWQDRRTASRCTALLSTPVASRVKALSGLPLDPMFSALKAEWLMNAHDPGRTRSGRGELCLGTVDSWLLFRLTGEHLTEPGNASRTQLFNVHSLDWDDELLGVFGVPRAILPEVRPSDGPFGVIGDGLGNLQGVPICGVLGDSHAALFAHGAFRPGSVKVTYGTGSSIMGLIDRPDLNTGLTLTVAWSLGDRAQHAAEGNIRSAGATLRWLSELLSSTPAKLAELAATLNDSPVNLVPAFGGLGAPWWDERASGLVSDLSLSTGPADLAYAAVASIAQQVADVVDALGSDLGPGLLYVDGGPTGNQQLMQLQADLTGKVVRRSLNPELSALGAAHLAGLTTGFWTASGLANLDRPGEEVHPLLGEAGRVERRARWRLAVRRARLQSGVAEVTGQA